MSTPTLTPDEQAAALSRDAQCIALALFPYGNRSEASFGKKAKLHPRTEAAINELSAAGLVKVIRYKGGATVCLGQKHLRDVVPLLPKMQQHESFPIMASADA